MKVSVAQLKMSLARLTNTILPSNQSDMTIDISILEANPGEGRMVDMVIISGTHVTADSKEDKETTMTVEVYPESEKQDPRATKVETFKVKGNY